MASLAAVGVSMFACFGCMLIGVYVQLGHVISDPARKGVAALYARIVFPTMVFCGVAEIDVNALDRSLLLVIFASKTAVAAAVLACGSAALRSTHDQRSLAHAAAWAMAATHSFDVTLGVPLARVLHPQSVAYVYLNQAVQLILVNPALLVLMESGGDGQAASGGAATIAGAVRAVASNPLVIMTVAGLLAGQLVPAGLPAPLAALAKQVAGAGPFLGFLSLGFAIASARETSRASLGASAALCAAKLVLMPLLYTAVAGAVGCEASPALLCFLGSLPASASVYSLTVTTRLSPKVVGPLVPTSWLRVAIGGAGIAGAMVVATVPMEREEKSD
jgi:predicted permease